MSTKRCNVQDHEGPRDLPLTEFGCDINSTDGHRYHCRKCENKLARKYREERKKRNLARQGQAPLVDVSTPVEVSPSTEVSPLAPEPKVVTVEETITNVEEHRLKAAMRELQAQNRSLLKDLSDAQAMNDLIAQARAQEVRPIEPREHASGMREATALVLASDWHIEEEVKPEQVFGRNRYNLEISKRRMERFFEATRWAIDFNRQAFLVRDAILWLGGDIISNYIHPDLIEVNLLAPPEAIAYAHSAIIAGIRYLLQDDKLERLVVTCNDGNHGRMTEQMRVAARVDNSIETLLYRMVAHDFRDEPRVQFVIADGSQLFYEVYGRTIRFTHGDTVKYGGGVGGITIPIYKALARWDTARKADLTCMGHWHQLTMLNDLLINGSLIGFSPYSAAIGARFEPPAQAFAMLDPKRFLSVRVPLWTADREDDEMNKEEE